MITLTVYDKHDLPLGFKAQCVHIIGPLEVLEYLKKENESMGYTCLLKEYGPNVARECVPFLHHPDNKEGAAGDRFYSFERWQKNQFYKAQLKGQDQGHFKGKVVAQYPVLKEVSENYFITAFNKATGKDITGRTHARF